MKQEDISNIRDVIDYLLYYAIQCRGEQPLAIGVKPDEYKRILEEALVKDYGMSSLRIRGVLVVPVS